MELWIRSQDRAKLCEAIHFELSSSELSILGQNKAYYGVVLGTYKSKERALEVLDEIQSKLKPTFLMKPKNDNYSKYVEDGKRYLEELNDISIVTGDRCFNLEPINSDVYVYEMPKE